MIGSYMLPTIDGNAPLGRHMVAEFRECTAGRLDDEPWLCAQAVAAAQACGARVVKTESHRYTPFGVTVVVILAESHLILHTWPEHAAAAVDAFVCGPSADLPKARDFLAQALGAGRIVDLEVRRP
jgi:spermidine synthase